MTFNFLIRHKWAKIAIVYWIVLCLWWLRIWFFGQEIGSENYLFNLSYIFFNISGGIAGIHIAKKHWGGFKSAVGKGLSFLGLGLLGQGLGLLIWTYYNLIIKIEIPYPSLADIGYFSLIPFYSYAMLNFAKATGAKVRIRTLSGKLQVVLIPMGLLVLSYIFFIQNVGLNLSNPIETFLNLGYPAGEALSVSLGILTFSLSFKVLGGAMKKRVLYLIFALIFQYLTEYTFLFTSGLGIYYNASFVDLMYASSYFLMTLGLLSFNRID